MRTFDASTAECLVFTFKEGLLSPVAHDLKLRVLSFGISVDSARGEVSARFDPASLEVVCARSAGEDRPDLLQPKDVADIHRYLRQDVLETDKHREIRFASDLVEVEDGLATVYGSLSLHGVTRSVHLVARTVESRWVTEVSLQQPDYGIRPFSAMLGTLRIKPEVTVRITLPAT